MRGIQSDKKITDKKIGRDEWGLSDCPYFFVGHFFVGLMLILASTRIGFAQDEQTAQPPTTQDPPSNPQTAPRSKWTFTLRNRTGFRLENPRVFQMSRTTFEASGKIKISDNWSVTLDGLAHIDPVKRLGYPDGLWLDPRQAFVDGRIKNVDVRLGLQQIVWGEADGLRVLDVINPLDYREFILEDFLESRRPLWAARIDVPAAKGSLQLVWVPYFAPGRLPAPTDEFGSGPSFGVGLIAAAVQPAPPIDVVALPTARPPYQLGSSQAGVRYRRSFANWDVTLNYFYGWEDIPTSYVESVTVDPGAGSQLVTLGPRFDRKEVFGATGTTNFGPVVVRLEAGWNRNKAAPAAPLSTSDGFLKAGQFSSVAGIDYSPSEWLWVSGQYFLRMTSAPSRALLFPRYDHLVSFFVRTNFFNEKLRPEVFVLTGLNRNQYMIRPRVTRTFGDHLTIGIGCDFLGGEPTTVFGFYDSKDRAVVEVKWMW